MSLLRGIPLLSAWLWMGMLASGVMAEPEQALTSGSAPAADSPEVFESRNPLSQELLTQTLPPGPGFPADCPPPALSRLQRHTITAGETIESIAELYNLIPPTLLGMNPVLRSGKASVGAQILIPPYNGIRVELQAGQTLQTVAKRYNVRPDVLFEVNGCQPKPKVVFVPGVNWSPNSTLTQPTPAQPGAILSGYPLPFKPSKAAILLGYGWRLQPASGKTVFHGGVDLAAPVGTSVLAVADGTVAFADKQGSYGNLVVINHREGMQTRYAQLGSIKVKAGQVVKRGTVIGTVGTSGTPSSKESHLHFEVRSRSNLGWVAENPEIYLLRDSARSNQAQK